MRVPFGLAAALLFTTSVGGAPAPNNRPEDKVICKRVYDADTGSHFQSSKRVCRTAADWKEIEDGTERVMKTIREHGGIAPSDLPPAIGGAPH